MQSISAARSEVTRLKILFVCLGNICRSPLAEGLFRRLAEEAGAGDRFEVDSAGTSSYHVGEEPHAGTRRIAEQQGISLDGKRARQVGLDDLENFDLLIAMDRKNAAGLLDLSPAARDKVHLLLDYADVGTKDVHDPYFDGDFERTYRQIEAGCQGLLRHVMQPSDP
jgi:protein-tyrosine phosphatase